MIEEKEEDFNEIFEILNPNDILSNSNSIEIVTGSIKNIYCTMLKSFEWFPPGSKKLIDIYNFIIVELRNFLNEMSDKSTVPPGYLINCFLKFRHNVFSSIIINNLIPEENKKTLKDFRKMDTDLDLSEYGINKTPDYMHEGSDVHTIIEFTVSKRRSAVDFLKGGELQETKYTDLIPILNTAKGIRHDLCIAALVLDDANLDSTIEPIKHLIFDEENLRENLRSFQTISNDHSDLIYKFAYISRVLGHKNSCTIKKVSENYRKSFIGNIKKPKIELKPVDNYIMKSINDNKNNFLRRISKKDIYFENESFHLVYRFSDEKTILIDTGYYNKFKLDEKMSINLINLKRMIKSNDINTIYSKTLVFKDYKIIKTSDLHKVDNYIDMKYSKINEINENTLNYKLKFNYQQGEWSPVSVSGFPICFESCDIVPEKECLVFFDSDYLKDLSNIDYDKIRESDKGNDLLVNNKLDQQKIRNSISNYEENTVKDFNKINEQRVKQTFIYPLMTGEIKYSRIKNLKNDDFLQKLSECLKDGSSSNRFTNSIINKILNGDNASVKDKRNEIIKKAFDNMNKYSHDYYEEMKAEHGEFFEREKLQSKSKRNPKLSVLAKISKEMENKRIHSIFLEYCKYRKEYQKELLDCSNIRVNTVRMASKKKSKLRIDFENETKHFRKCKNTFPGVNEDQNCVNDINQYFMDLSDRMMNPCCTMTRTEVRSKIQGPDSKFMNDVKKSYSEGYDEVERFYRQTQTAKWSEFISSFCYTLCKFSTTNTSGDYFSFSKMSYDNCLLIVKGGKKSISTGKSRLFRLVYPINNSDKYYGGFESNDDYSIIRMSTSNYILTPWSVMHEDVMNDGMSLYNRLFIYTSVYLKREGEISNNYNRNLFFPILLSMNNRRKVEQTLHNMRYLIVNLLGEWSNLEKMMPPMSLFPYSFFEVWINNCIINNYFSFSESVFFAKDSYIHESSKQISLGGMKHLFMGRVLKNYNEMTELIYSTYLMTKSPAGKALDQVSNLKKVFKDVKDFNNNHVSQNGSNDISSYSFDITNFKMDDIKDDFYFDKKYCNFLGSVMGSYLKDKVSKNEIDSKWESIMNSPIDDMSNSSGLRGTGKFDFFDKKGHEIIYNKMSEKIKKIEEMVDKLNDNDSNTNSKTSFIFDNNLSFSDYINENDLENARFHIVDKKQRGGGREIYVMDVNTKAYQYPLEKFFSFLCKNTENEYISIPSNKRLEKIHSKFHEKSDHPNHKKSNWVLDKSRWAPHSITEKYCYFISGFSDHLPETFLEHFYYFFKKMLTKRVYTRDYVVKKLENNISFNDYKDLLIEDFEATKDGSYFTMKFSFMMGIFNYLSSLMHAANQIVASETIRNYVLMKNDRIISLKMICHSDDSSGVCYYQNDSDLEKAVLIYDVHMKAANHKMSIKKSQVNKGIYFEFLSILYFGGQLLPLTAKFLPSINFTPTDKGYSSDISIAASKGLECMNAGSTMQEAYLVTKTLEMYIQRFYSIKDIRYDVPYCFLGGIDPHPLQMMLCGMTCEIYKHLNYNKEKSYKVFDLMESMKLINIDDVTNFNLEWDMGSKMNDRLKKQMEKYDYLIEKIKTKWTLKNVKSKNSLLNFLWYISKMKEKSFYDSLVQESNTRKLLRVMGSYNNRSVVGSDRIYKIKEVCDSIAGVLDSDNFVSNENDLDWNRMKKLINSVCSELHSFQECTSDYNYESLTPDRLERHCKPISLNSRGNKVGSTIEMPINFSTVYTFEKEMVPYLSIKKDYSKDVKKINMLLSLMGFEVEKMTKNNYSMLVNLITGKENKSFKFLTYYTGISGKKSISTTMELFTFLRQCSFFNFELKGATKLLESRVNYHFFEKNKIPPTIIRILKLKWVCSVLDENPILRKKDVLIRNPYEELKNEMSDSPSDWIMFLNSMFKEGDTFLEDIKFWHCWVESQTRVFGKWVGRGKLLVSLAECYVRITFFDNNITDVETNLDPNITNLMKSSSWYMDACVIPELQNRFLFSDPELANEKKLYLGYSIIEDCWCINYPSKLDRILSLIRTNYSLLPDWFDNEVYLVNDKNGSYFTDQNDGKKIELIFANSSILRSAINLTDFINFKKIREKHTLGCVNQTLKNISLKTGQNLKINYNILADNIKSTKLYKIVYNHFDSCDKMIVTGPLSEANLINSLFYHKQSNKDFEMVSMDDIKRTKDSNIDLDIPTDLILKNKYLQRCFLDKGLTIKIADEIRTCFMKRQNQDDEDFVSDIKKVMSRFGEASVENILSSELLKNDTILNNCGLITCLCLGKDQLKPILIEIVLSFMEFFKNEFCNYPLFNVYNSIYKMDKSSTRSYQYFLELYFIQMIMSCLMKGTPTHEGNLYVDILIGSIEFLIDHNESMFYRKIEDEFNKMGYLKTISFSRMSKNIFIKWISDVFGSLCSFDHGMSKETMDSFNEINKLCGGLNWVDNREHLRHCDNVIFLSFFPTKFHKKIKKIKKNEISSVLPSKLNIRSGVIIEEENKIKSLEIRIRNPTRPRFGNIYQPVMLTNDFLINLEDCPDQEEKEDEIDEYDDMYPDDWEMAETYAIDSELLVKKRDNQSVGIYIKDVGEVKVLSLIKNEKRFIVLSSIVPNDLFKSKFIRVYTPVEIECEFNDFLKIKKSFSCLLLVGFPIESRIVIKGWKEGLSNFNTNFFCNHDYISRSGLVFKKTLDCSDHRLADDLLTRDNLVNRLTVNDSRLDLDWVNQIDEYNIKLNDFLSDPGFSILVEREGEEYSIKETKKSVEIRNLVKEVYLKSHKPYSDSINLMIENRFNKQDKERSNKNKIGINELNKILNNKNFFEEEDQKGLIKKEIESEVIDNFESVLKKAKKLFDEKVVIQNIVDKKYLSGKEDLTELLQTIKKKVNLKENDIMLNDSEVISQLNTLIGYSSNKFLSGNMRLTNNSYQMIKWNLSMIKSSLKNKVLKEKFNSFELIFDYFLKSSEIIEFGNDDCQIWFESLNKMRIYFCEESDPQDLRPPAPGQQVEMEFDFEDYHV